MTPESLSTNPRYALLDEQLLLARGEDLQIDIRGGPEHARAHVGLDHPGGRLHERCSSTCRSAPTSSRSTGTPRSAWPPCRSRLGANSPYFLGRTSGARPASRCSPQAADTRPAELKAQGVRPRVWFGERWITSVFDLFEENTTLLPRAAARPRRRGPGRGASSAGGTPSLHELRLHNGTVWRWNRPVYDIVAGRPHLRRGEPGAARPAPPWSTCSPTARSTSARCRSLAGQDRPVWTPDVRSRRPRRTSRVGRDARHRRDGLLARHRRRSRHRAGRCAGCSRWRTRACARGASTTTIRERLLGIIEGRCTSGRNGATWQVDAGRDRFEARGHVARGGAATHDPGVRRADAHQRAGPHLGRRLSGQREPATEGVQRSGREDAHAGTDRPLVDVERAGVQVQPRRGGPSGRGPRAGRTSRAPARGTTRTSRRRATASVPTTSVGAQGGAHGRAQQRRRRARRSRPAGRRDGGRPPRSPRCRPSTDATARCEQRRSVDARRRARGCAACRAGVPATGTTLAASPAWTAPKTRPSCPGRSVSRSTRAGARRRRRPSDATRSTVCSGRGGVPARSAEPDLDHVGRRGERARPAADGAHVELGVAVHAEDRG